MTVKQLISKLKKMPQHLEVGVSTHDNAEWEIAGWPCSVYHFVKSECYVPADPYDTAPDECVVLHC